MRLQALHLKAYGKFTDFDIELPNGTVGLHVLYGANEAGKSTALRALSDMLFGFGHTTTADFLHDAKSLRLGARIASRGGEVLEFVRRKGRAGTLRTAEDGVLDDLVLAPFLGGAERGFFETMFGLDHERLRRGGQDLLEGRGEVGLGLFEAATGIVNLRQVLKELEAEAEELFKPKGRNQKLNMAIEALTTARKQAKHAALSADDWRDVRKRLDELEELLASGGESIRSLQKERSRLERLRRNLPLLAQRQALLEQRDVLADVPDLPEDAPRRRVEAQSGAGLAREQRRASENEIALLAKERDGLTVPEDVLAAEDEIQGLHTELGAIRKAEDDRPRRDAEMRQKEEQMEGLLRDLRWDVPVGQAKDRLPPRPLVAGVRALLTQEADLNARGGAAETSRKECEKQLNRYRRDLEGLAAARDVTVLQSAVAAAQAEGAVEERLRQKQAALREGLSVVEQDLPALPMFSGTLEALAALPVPLDATVERFTGAVAKAHQEIVRCQERLRDVEGEAARLRDEIARMTDESEVPTRDSLEEARAQRERGWRLVRQAYVDAREDVREEAAAYDAARPLPEAYEHRVGEADRVADLIHAEAERVTKHATLTASLERVVLRVEEERASQERAEESLRALQDEWRAAWVPCGMEPLPPLEMQAWLRQRGQLLQRREGLTQLRAEVEQLEGRVTDLSTLLSRALATIDEPAAKPGESLAALLERASALVKSEEKLQRKREEWAGRVREQEKQAEDLAAQQVGLEQERGGWRERWAQSLTRIGLPADGSPEEVQAGLDATEELAKLVPTWEQLQRRISRIDEDRESFEGRSAALVARVAGDLRGTSSVDSVKSLNQRLQRAKKDAERLVQIAEDVARHQKTLDEANRAIERHEAEIARLCRQAGDVGEDQLEDVESRAASKRDVLGRLRQLESNMLAGGAGLSVEQMAQEAEGVDGDSLASGISAIAQEVDERNESSRRLATEKGQVEEQLRAMRGGDDAAQHLQSAEEALTRVKSGAEQYVRLVVAAQQLRRAVDRYRESSQGPLVRLAGTHFSRLTRGGFTGLTVDYEEDNQRVLLGVRPDGKVLGVEAMSTGTRDQLFLALRLAAIQHYIERSEPLPIVADDLLINFDDERAKAALELLAEVSGKAQVLFFTHHARLVELAERQGGCSVHRL